MKKTIIILAVILTTGLTASSLTKNVNKVPAAKTNVEKVNLGTNTANLATAD